MLLLLQRSCKDEVLVLLNSAHDEGWGDQLNCAAPSACSCAQTAGGQPKRADAGPAPADTSKAPPLLTVSAAL